MAEIRNVRQNEKGNWVGDTPYSREVPVEVERTNFRGEPTDVRYQGEPHNDTCGNSRYPSSSDDSNR